MLTANGVSQSTAVIISDHTVNTDGFEKNAPYVFVIETFTADVTVIFESHWGVPASPSVMADSTFSVSVIEEDALED